MGCHNIIDGFPCRYAAGHHGKCSPYKKMRSLTGAISHWGRIDKRSHLLIAKVPDDFQLGEWFKVKVVSVPTCNDCGRKTKQK